MLEKIFTKLKANGKLTSEEQNYLYTALKSAASGKIPSGETSEFKSYEDFNKTLSSGMSEVYNSPGVKEFADSIIRNKRSDVFIKRYKPIFNAIQSGIDIGTSISQIKNADKAIKALAKPAVPAVPGLDPALDASIQSIRPDAAAQRALLPAEALLREQRMADLMQAQQTSGGQAAAYSTLGNIASQRASRAASQLIPLTDQVRAREQARLDNLLGLRANIGQQNFVNAAGLYRTSLDQYNTELGAAGALGQAGRLNLRNTMASFPENFIGAASQLMPVYNPYYNKLPQGNPTPTSNMYSDQFDEYGKQVTRSLANQIGSNPLLRQKDPNYFYN